MEKAAQWKLRQKTKFTISGKNCRSFKEESGWLLLSIENRVTVRLWFPGASERQDWGSEKFCEVSKTLENTKTQKQQTPETPKNHWGRHELRVTLFLRKSTYQSQYICPALESSPPKFIKPKWPIISIICLPWTG